MNKNEIKLKNYLSTQKAIFRGNNKGVHSHFHAG